MAGPVGSGKTALVEVLCKQLRQRWQLAVVTNDIYTREDAQFLLRSGALPPARIRGVETGGCPHTGRIGLAPHVGASLAVMEADTRRMRGERPWCFTNLRTGQGVQVVEMQAGRG